MCCHQLIFWKLICRWVAINQHCLATPSSSAFTPEMGRSGVPMHHYEIKQFVNALLNVFSSPVVCQWCSYKLVKHPQWKRCSPHFVVCSTNDQKSLWPDRISYSHGNVRTVKATSAAKHHTPLIVYVYLPSTGQLWRLFFPTKDLPKRHFPRCKSGIRINSSYCPFVF